MTMRILDKNIKVNGNFSEEEVKYYVSYAKKKYKNAVESIEITQTDGDVELKIGIKPVPFERIRRITGYLVGTLDKWNNAKRAEERDRVKHDCE